MITKKHEFIGKDGIKKIVLGFGINRKDSILNFFKNIPLSSVRKRRMLEKFLSSKNLIEY